ncbi:MAG: YsnF/AvaK domain-containing protein [Rhodothermales bacterium]|nr:YsnF/AvaK domain-containing protein [Rhodothermales bacterium]
MTTASTVTDTTGRRATVEGSAAASGAEQVTLRLDDGRRLQLPARFLHEADGHYRLSVAFDEVLAAAEGGREEVVLEEAEERLRVRKRVRESGRVRLTKRVEEREETVDVPLLHEEVEVERVPVGTFIEAAPDIRHEGDLTIIPVVEEVLVVEKRLRLVEELHVRKRQEEVHRPQTVTLRRTQVDVERVDPPPDARSDQRP